MNPSDARIALTGATGGIGRETAAAFIGAGASVLLIGRSAAQLSSLSRSIQATATGSAGRIAWQVADLGRPAQLDELVGVATEWRCNVLVHAAGVPCFGALESVDAETMRRVLDINLLAPMRLTQALLPHLRAQARAQVICLGSALGRIGLPGFSIYSASKFGLRGFAEALRRELRGTGIRVQYVGPRSTRTGFNDAAVQAYNAATGTAMDSPSRVAETLLRSLQDEAAERFIGFPERLAVRINGAVPTLLDGSFDKHRRSVPPPSADTALPTQRSNQPGVSSPIESPGAPR
jgi:short-subunit dehydrogenase